MDCLAKGHALFVARIERLKFGSACGMPFSMANIALSALECTAQFWDS